MSQALSLFTKFQIQWNLPPVKKAARTEAERAMMTLGAFIRTGIKSTLRRGKKIAQPGQPPKVHEKTNPRIRAIYFAPYGRSVVIGHVLLGSKGRESRYGVPNLLEYGGPRTYVLKSGKRRNQRYRPHPHLKAGMMKGIEQFAKKHPDKHGLVKDSIADVLR